MSRNDMTTDLKPARESFVETPSGRVRIWEKGRGKRVGFFAGLAGLPKWLPFLDELAKTHRVIAPSLPGFPGGPSSETLDGPLDWTLAAGDVFDAADLGGADLIGASVGGALAAEVAAFWPDALRKLVLIAPFGLFDESEPVTDVFAQRPGQMAQALSERPQALNEWLAMPDGADAGEWEIMSLRAHVAAASMLWPLGDTRLARRLPRISAKTLVLWGAQDRVIPPSYAGRFATLIGKNARAKTIAGAGHLAAFDQPKRVAKAVTNFLAG